MTATFDVKVEYEHCLDMSATAFAAGYFEVAYHLLMAALHCAQDARDAAGLAEVGRKARTCLAEIDSRFPSHSLSSRTAEAHGHRSVFEMGAVTADSMLQRLDLEDRLAARRHRPRSED